jgi:hypothetical protein
VVDGVEDTLALHQPRVDRVEDQRPKILAQKLEHLAHRIRVTLGVMGQEDTTVEWFGGLVAVAGQDQ